MLRSLSSLLILSHLLLVLTSPSSPQFISTVDLAGVSKPPILLPLFPSSPPQSRHRLRRRLLHGSDSDSNSSSARMPLYDDLLSRGYYSTRLFIGTPPQEFALIVDTGSTVTYVPCDSCQSCGRHQDPRFKPEESSTYKPVKCNINCRCDEKRNSCIYDRRYAEQSSSSGVLGDDIVSFGGESELKPQHVVFGCENSESGDLYTQRADGIIGLGRGPLSIMDQLVGKGAIDNSFSLCYGGMDLGGGTMILGAHELPVDMVFAQSDPSRSQYYNIELKEIHVAGKPLKLSPRVFDGSHGTVLDSGTTYAYFPKEAYSAFKNVISESVHPLIRTPAPDPSYQDICFGGAGRDVSQLSRTFPQVVMVFGNGQKLTLSPENYLFRHTKVPGAYCLGIFQNGNDQTTLLGGIIVRNTLVTYDRENERVGFWKTNCSDLWKNLKVHLSPPSSPSVYHSKNTSFGLTPAPAPVSSPPTNDFFSGDFRVGVITFEITFLTDESSKKPNMTELGTIIANGLHIDFSQMRMLNFASEGNHYFIRWAIYPVDSASYITSSQAKSIIVQLTGHHLKLPGNFGSYEVEKWDVEPQAKRPQLLAVFIGSFAILAIFLSIIGMWFLRRRLKQALHPYEPVDSIVAEQELQPLRTLLS